MIAVIEPKFKVVWGFGPTPEAAMADAMESVASKVEKIRPKMSDLQYAHLAPDADLKNFGDGHELWQWVILDQSKPAPADAQDQQLRLF